MLAIYILTWLEELALMLLGTWLGENLQTGNNSDVLPGHGVSSLQFSSRIAGSSGVRECP